MRTCSYTKEMRSKAKESGRQLASIHVEGVFWQAAVTDDERQQIAELLMKLISDRRQAAQGAGVQI